MLEIAGEMQAEISSAVTDAFLNLPKLFIFRIKADFFFKFVEILMKKRDKMFGYHT